MSRKATPVADAAHVHPFEYGPPQPSESGSTAAPSTRVRSAQVVSSTAHARASLGTTQRVTTTPTPSGTSGEDVTTLQQAAFAQGYAQGERAGVEVAARQLQAVHERLGQTIDRVAGLRETLTYRTEREVVELALAIAARILHREVALDRELLLVMARIALDRMGDSTAATIRLHPDDEAAARRGREGWTAGTVSVVADPAVEAGGCLVQTDHGQIEVGVDAQIRELATALLGDAPTHTSAAS